MPQSTWAQETATWDTKTGIWNNQTYQDYITFSLTSEDTLGYNTKYSVTADMTQTIFSELNEEDTSKVGLALLGLSSGTTAAAAVQAPVSGTLSNTSAIVNNTNYEEGGTINMYTNNTANNNFLWNEEEDTSTTWTKVSDPDN